MGMQQVTELDRERELRQAETQCRRELLENPFDPVPCHTLATLLHRRGERVEALDLMRRAVALAPRAVEPRVNLAAMLSDARRPELALKVLAEAVQLRADLPELHSNLGVVLERLQRPAEAASAYRTAIALRPDYPEAHFNLGNALRALGRLDEAMGEYRHAVRLRPNYVKPRAALVLALAELGELPEALRHAREAAELQPDDPTPRGALLYAMHYDPAAGPEELWREHRAWGETFCDPLRSAIPAHRNNRSPERKLRIGYVSPDFCEATPPKFITAALQYRDRESFETFAYSDVARPDAVTARLRPLFDHWRETRGLQDRAVAEFVRQDRIDILVDLRGHAADNRLPMFCLKPAPVQVNMVGYFDTTGLSTMDYRITDEYMDPLRQLQNSAAANKEDAALFFPDPLHTEKLVRLAGSCWCYTADEDSPPVADSPILKNGYVTFGSLNKIVKVSEPCARLWARALDAVPGSKLLLSVASADAAGTVRKRLESYGIQSDRLIIADKTRTRTEYLQRFGRIDLALDTWPFNGITTTCDGLWMGVPCVSLTGQTSVSRAGKSILHAAGLGELATDSPDEFVSVASELARDIERLTEMRRSMRERLIASALMDHRRFARNLEASYRQMWHTWCAGQRPGD